jgi:hypothetical protein
MNTSDAKAIALLAAIALTELAAPAAWTAPAAARLVPPLAVPAEAGLPLRLCRARFGLDLVLSAHRDRRCQTHDGQTGRPADR